MYYAGTTVFGSTYDLSYGKLLAGAARFPEGRRAPRRRARGARLRDEDGLVPVHTWLPDAHSEAPTPISALLSGALLATSFYAILRFFQVSVRCLGPAFPRTVLLVFGLASLVLAALYLLSQRDLKRLLAYSSVEHMGILAIGMSFSAPDRDRRRAAPRHRARRGEGHGVLRSRLGRPEVHDEGHARDPRRRRALPWSGPMLVLAVLALSAMPPFGIFRSEFLIVVRRALRSAGRRRGGARRPRHRRLLRAVVVHDRDDAHARSADGGRASPTAPARGETSGFIVVAMALGLAGLVVLGCPSPGQLSHLLHHAAGQLEAHDDDRARPTSQRRRARSFAA